MSEASHGLSAASRGLPEDSHGLSKPSMACLHLFWSYAGPAEKLFLRKIIDRRVKSAPGVVEDGLEFSYESGASKFDRSMKIGTQGCFYILKRMT